jgi:hypothetical protein
MMKKTFLIAVVTLLTSITLLAQNKKLEGNGKLVTRDVSVASFNTLKAHGVYELHLVQGSKEGVKIEADENLQELFTVKNDGAKLLVEMKTPKNTSLNVKNKMKVYVTFKDLKQLDINTVGEVRNSNQLSFDDIAINNHSVGDVDLNFTAKKLALKNKSVGEMTLRGAVQDATFVNNGVGSLNAGSLVVQTLDIDNGGVGSAEVNAVKGLKVKDSFLGKVTNKGAASTRKKNIVVL